MCCFSGIVRDVSHTQIFGRLTDQGTQYLAYQMQYESDEPNAMILPLPVKTPASEDSVRFIDLSGYKRLFRDLAKGFPDVRRRRYFPNSRAAPVDSAVKLVVHEVGDFVASFVPTVDDFARLDPQFVIPKETWLQIPVYKDYGFAIFQLRKGAVRPHPMAFEFDTRHQEVFFPTVHIHDGEVHQREHFDHTLYMQHAGFDSVSSHYRGPKHSDPNTKFVRSKFPAEQFCETSLSGNLIQPDLLVHRMKMRGTFENRDLMFAGIGSPVVRTFNHRQLKPWWPAGLGVGALAWIIARRNRVANIRHGTADD